ncbi:phage tail protein [Bacillus mycoides]|uniref:phage tail protein n=1 Tax=Bacillus mycoides TaxID=1405 RepID=UPI001F3FB633|nr:tail length tape measure protein [Bacillus mycoides]
MADGRVEIDTRLETGNVRRDVQRVNSELSHIGDGVADAARGLTDEVGARYDSLGRRIRYAYRGTSEEARRMYSEMRSAHYQQAIAMRGVKDQMIGAQYQYFKLAQASQNYTGTTREFLSEVNKIGKAHKTAADAAINGNRLAMMGMLQTIGYMQNMTTQATRIRENYARMANPLYTINSAGLRAADALNRMANAGNASVLALKMLGPTASMKDLKNMTMTITQGLMRFQMVALAAAATSAIFYASLFKAAKGPSPADVLKEQTKAMDEYRDAVIKRTEEIMTAWGLFEKVTIKPPDSSQLISNLEGQVTAMRNWKDNLADIAQHAGSEFANYLSQMGPKAAAEVQTLANMTGPELDKYVQLWKEKLNLSRTQAEVELEGLRQMTMQKIKELQDTLTPLGIAWEKLSGAFAEAVKPMVEAFGMLMTPLVNFATKFFELVAKFNEAHPTIALIIQAIIMLVPALTLLLSPLAIGIGLWNGMLAAWNSIWMLISPLVTGLAAMSATVWVVSAAIVGLVAGLIYLWNTSEGFRSAINSVITVLQAFWQVIVGNSGGAASMLTSLGMSPENVRAIISFGETVRVVIETIKQIFTDFSTFIMGVFAIFSGNEGKGVSMLSSLGLSPETVLLIISSINTIKEAINTGLTAIWEFMSDIGSQIAQFWLENGTQIKEAAGNVWNAVLSVIQTVMPIIVSVMKVLWPIIKEIVIGTWEAIKNVINGALNIIMGIVKVFSSLFTGDWKGVWEGVKQIWNGALELLWGWLQLWGAGRILKWLGKFAGDIVKPFVKFWGDIKRVWNDALAEIYVFFGSKLEKITAFTSSWGGMIKNFFGEIWSSIVNGVSSKLEGVVTGVEMILNKVVKFVTGLGKTFYNAGQGLIEMMAKGIKNAASWVTDAVGDLAQKARDFLPFSPAKTGPLSDLDHLDFGGPITDSIKLAFPQVGGLMNELLDLPPIVSNVKTTRNIESKRDTKSNDSNGTNNNNSPTYIVLDKKVVGEALAEPVESTNNRRKQRLAQFKPTVTPSF